MGEGARDMTSTAPAAVGRRVGWLSMALLCLLASATYSAAATYAGLWWLGLVSLAPLVIALRSARSWLQVLLLSWLAFALAILVACSWIAPALNHFAVSPRPGGCPPRP
jgi:apolipoprotein N-acyltransferase